MRKALRTLHDEHLTLIGLLHSILAIVTEAGEREAQPDFKVLRAMLFYIAEFPEKRHHRHETELLFPKLRALSPSLRPLLDRLDEDHRRGEAKVRELEHGLTALELLGPSHRGAFGEAARRYVDFHLSHIALEEREILPVAARVLAEEDWEEIEEAMARDPDPLAAIQPGQDYPALFATIAFHKAADQALVGASFAGDCD
jgi:hemerythrin-like domain-containing protein